MRRQHAPNSSFTPVEQGVRRLDDSPSQVRVVKFACGCDDPGKVESRHGFVLMFG
jgi:hypothetical protein